MEESLYLHHKEKLVKSAKALSSETRIDILQLLGEKALNVNDIAEELGIPSSSAAMNVRILEEAGLIRTELLPGIRGSMKLCFKQVDQVTFYLQDLKKSKKKIEIIEMPVGNYVDYQVAPTCGMVSEKGPIDEEDEPRCFYNPERIKAKLIWFGSGYLEYRFSNAGFQDAEIEGIELSAELCSETADYDMNYPSDITLWMNHMEAGTWNCPSDFGGRRGKLNPGWWPDKNSQYGNLKTWRIDSSGTYLDGIKANDRPLSGYYLTDSPYLSVKIGMKEEAVHRGGVNIFGDSFGDYPQNILLRVEYK